MTDLSVSSAEATAKKKPRAKVLTEKDLDAYTAKLDQPKEQLDEREQELDDIAIGLENRENALHERENELDYCESQVSIYGVELTEALRRCPELRAGLRQLAVAGEIRWPI
jgi:predicted  nucleic acid-binding Zn-ribbon protein